MSQPTGIVGDGSKLLLGRGAVYFDRLTSAGVKTGDRFLGNCTGFTISGTEELKEMRSSVDSANGLLARVPYTRTLEVGFTLTEFEENNLALALLGDVGAYTQAATLVTDETVSSSVVQGRWYKCSKRKTNALTAVKAGVAGSTAVTNTNNNNWIEDNEVGRIYVVVGAPNIANGDILKVTYTPTAISGTTLPLASLGTAAGAIKGAIRFVGDPVNGKILECELWSAALTPDGEISLIGDDFGEFKMKGTLLSDAVNNPTQPFGRMFVR